MVSNSHGPKVPMSQSPNVPKSQCPTVPNDENNIPKEWTTSNSRIEQEQVDQNREKYSSVSEAQCSVLGRPISIWTTHVVSSAHQLKSSFSSPSDTSAVKATNGRKPDVKIARRAKVKEPSKKFEQMMKTLQKDEVKKRMKQGQKAGKKNPGANIAYWLPWWNRMEREAEKLREELKKN
jgi:hypothetical protein